MENTKEKREKETTGALIPKSQPLINEQLWVWWYSFFRCGDCYCLCISKNNS